MRRSIRLVAVWTLAWTCFQWWAVIGWPETLDGSYVALLATSLLSIVGLTLWAA